MANQTSETLRIHPDKMRQLFYEILTNRKLPQDKARKCADVFTENSAEGVLSHGVNRFHRFVTLLDKAAIDPFAEPLCVHQAGALEQWNGNNGLGITNAIACTERAIALASDNGLGCVAIGYTNHWMRAGTYARLAASKGFALIAWSNTIRNTPAWGAVDPRLGNNPITIGIPHGESPVVLDMAMSQFSYGALEGYKMKNKSLPVYGGYDSQGNLSVDPAAIIESRRTLPIGYWKGAGLSLLLDMLGVILSGGLSVSQISKQQEEKNLTQIFIAFNLKALKNFPSMATTLEAIIEDVKQSTVVDMTGGVRYPGEGIQAIRQKSYREGILVDAKKWNEILALEGR